MIPPKEKAKEILTKMHFDKGVPTSEEGIYTYLPKNEYYIECSLILVDEILDNFPNEFWMDYLLENFEYWQDVKTEIENYKKQP